MASERARAAKAAYDRAWRKRNPDKVKAYRERYWEKKAQEMEANEAAGDSDRGVVE